MGNGQNIILVVFIMLCSFQTQCHSRLHRSSSSTSKPRGPHHRDHFLCHPQQSRALLQFKSHFVTDPSASLYCIPEYSSEGTPNVTEPWSTEYISSMEYTSSIEFSCDGPACVSSSSSSNNSIGFGDMEDTRNKTRTWNDSRDCCSSWHGVACNPVTGHVTGLDLSCSMLKLQLEGSEAETNNRSYDIFSSLFASIPNLNTLNLAHNDFEPVDMSSLSLGLASLAPSLTHLNLSQSSFSGYVPFEISHLSKLVSLDLSSNDDLRFESATVLKSMALNLTQLRVLNLGETSLLALPDYASSLMNLSSSLTSLSLFDSGLQGTFPENFIFLPNLRELKLSGNSNLTGSLPKLLNSTSLRVLRLSSTGLSGELPDSIGNFNSLQVLDLGSCNFSGAIPSSLGHLSQLHELDLGGNALTGQFPNVILNLTQLEKIDLSRNQLEGSLPTPSGHSFPYLSSIDLSYNSLNGSIPSWLFALPSLIDFRLSNNRLSGPLSKSILPSLSFLDLSNNELNGSIPKAITRSVDLTNLDLSHNFFTGSVGKHLDFEYLYLNSNLLEGSLPVPSSDTVHFSVSNNRFEGEVPSSICQSSLQLLDLSFNRLSGMIPRCLGNVTSLERLNLCMNSFHGTIPDTFAKDSELTYLKLNGNQLGGVLPRSLANCEDLEALDVGNNSIEDVFPRWMQNLEQLQVLALRSNKLYGRVDIDLKMNSPFPVLRILDLSNNNFSGVLPSRLVKSLQGMINVSEHQGEPQYMGSHEHVYSTSSTTTMEGPGMPLVKTFKAFTFYSEYEYSVMVSMKGTDRQLVKILDAYAIIDMSNNKFDGRIPPELGSLHALKGLNLSHNHLAGPIPPSFGKLVNVEWLDLSSNNLVGRIPTQLLDMNSLAVLDLSYNNLHGLVPTGKQFNTFKDESYVGNPGLCGVPLPTCGASKKPSPPMQSTLSDESTSTFSWKSSYVGYGCGTVFGMAMGYLVFSTRSPHWFVKMVEGERKQKGRRPRTNAKARGRGTRN